jgi:hypothetical protein
VYACLHMNVCCVSCRVVTNQHDVEIAHFSCPEERDELSSTDNGITIVKLGPGQHVKAMCIATLVSTSPTLYPQPSQLRVAVTFVLPRRLYFLAVVIGCWLLAVQGVGKMHYKWSPVATCVYQYESDIRLNPGTLSNPASCVAQLLGGPGGGGGGPPTPCLPAACCLLQRLTSGPHTHGCGCVFTPSPEMLERLTPDQRQAFVAAVQPGVLEYDESTGAVRVSDRASRLLNNMDDFMHVGQLHSKGEDNLVTVTMMPERFWFKVEPASPPRTHTHFPMHNLTHTPPHAHLHSRTPMRIHMRMVVRTDATRPTLSPPNHRPLCSVLVFQLSLSCPLPLLLCLWVCVCLSLPVALVLAPRSCAHPQLPDGGLPDTRAGAHVRV